MNDLDRRRAGGAEYGLQPMQPSMRPAPGANGAARQAPPPAGGYVHDDNYAGLTEAVADVATASEPTVHLSRAYMAHGEKVQIIRFRKPTTNDLRRCGYPLRNVITPGVGVTGIDEIPEVVARYIVRLSDPPLPDSTVNELSLDDFSRCSGAIIGFFL